MNRIKYPDDDFNTKLYESLFGGKLNHDIFKKKKLTEGKKRLTEAPWVWKDDDEVEDDKEISNENGVVIKNGEYWFSGEALDLTQDELKEFREVFDDVSTIAEFYTYSPLTKKVMNNLMSKLKEVKKGYNFKTGAWTFNICDSSDSEITPFKDEYCIMINNLDENASLSGADANDEEDEEENSVGVEQAAREIVDIMFNDKDFREEQAGWIKGQGFSGGDPFLAACKYFRDYCEMPEEDDALKEFVGDYEDEHDCELDDDIYDLIAEYLGEKACKEYGAQAYFDILMKPSDFYDLGE